MNVMFHTSKLAQAVTLLNCIPDVIVRLVAGVLPVLTGGFRGFPQCLQKIQGY